MTFIIIYAAIGIIAFVLTSAKIKWDYYDWSDVASAFIFSAILWPFWLVAFLVLEATDKNRSKRK